MAKGFSNDNPFGVTWDRFDDAHHTSNAKEQRKDYTKEDENKHWA